MVKQGKDLKIMANEAKKRLSSGYFQHNDKEDCIVNKHQFHSNGVNYLDEERMYKIVCEIMRSDEIVLNPIGMLMDKKYFDSLSYPDRQRYVFKLSEIYVKLKNRYLNNNASC